MRLSAILFYILISFHAFTQQDYIEIINTKNGLSQNDVLEVFQDSYGFLWFGTNDGLNRYDGREFKFYNIEDGMSSGLITCISEDKNRNLWVGTINSGVIKLNLKTGLVEATYEVEYENESLNNEISEIVCDSAIIWVATKKGVGKISKGDTFIKPANFNNNQFIAGAMVQSGVWIEENSTVWILLDNKLFYVLDDNIKLLHEFKSGVLRKISKSGSVYVVGSTTGAYYFELKDFNLVNLNRINYSDVTDILTDSTDNIYLGGNTGIKKYKFSEPHQKFIQDDVFNESIDKLGISDFKVLSLYQDYSGILYFGVLSKGVFKYNRIGKKFDFNSLEDYIVQNTVRNIYQDSGERIYISTDGGILSKNEEESPSEESKPNGFVKINEIGNPIFTINEVVNLVGTKVVVAGGGYRNSLSIFGKSELHIPKINSQIFAIQQDRNGYIWLGSYGNGLYRYYPHKDSILKQFLPTDGENSICSDIIRSFCLDSKNRLWIGTSKGLCLLTESEQQKTNPKFIHFSSSKEDSQSLNHNYILPIIEASDGTIWIGTLGGGLNKLLGIDSNGIAKFHRFSTKNGLPNNVIKAIIEDNNSNLWIATNKGLSKYSINSSSFKNYSIDDGLQDNEYSELAACKLSDGQLIFGGVNGINSFYPSNLMEDTTMPIPAFTEFYVLNRKIEPNSKIHNRVLITEDINSVSVIKLKHFENSFVIGFAPLHFALPEKNKSRYKLEGFDNTWIEAEHGNIANYTNLDHGEYSFNYLAGNRDGIWANTVKKVKIVIAPPIWLTSYMKVLYLLLSIFLLWFFRKYTIIGVKRKHELLIQIQSLILNKEQLKDEFRNNISLALSNHGLKSNDEKFLNSVLRIVEKNISKRDFTINELADLIGVSQPTLNKRLVKLTGQKAREFLRTLRLKRAAQLLKTHKYSIREVVELVGFSDQQYFRKTFKEEFGYLPSENRGDML